MDLTMATTALLPRQSPMNRTMIVSKKAIRRPGLPEVSPTTDENCEKIGDLSADSLEQILAQNLVSDEVAKAILETQRMKDRQWREMVEKAEKERAMSEIKLASAMRTCQKAAQLFHICDQNGIDLDAILAARPDAIEQLQNRQKMIMLVQQQCSTPNSAESPNSEKAEMARLARDREALSAEVHSLEENYSNLFKLYEKMRMNCVNLKETEQSLRFDLGELSNKYSALQQMYTELLWEAQRKLDGAQVELNRAEREHQEKTLGIRLALKRSQIQIGALESALKTKAKENEELHAICDQLIAARDTAMGSAGEEDTEENSE